jgi:phage shock protein C
MKAAVSGISGLRSCNNLLIFCVSLLEDRYAGRVATPERFERAMQSRLMRSRRDAVIAGVCGGLGEYFNIDPVIVRLIFVLATLTSGIGFVLYPVLWLIMPKAPPGMPPAFPDTAQHTGNSGAVFTRQASEAQYARQARYGETSAYSSSRGTVFADAPPEPPNTGQTIDLRLDPSMAPLSPQSAPAPVHRRRRLNWAGIVLIGLGLIFLAEQFGIDTDIVFPLLMIVVGGVLIFRNR